jgi:hypothetical protein
MDVLTEPQGPDLGLRLHLGAGPGPPLDPPEPLRDDGGGRQVDERGQLFHVENHPRPVGEPELDRAAELLPQVVGRLPDETLRLGGAVLRPAFELVQHVAAVRQQPRRDR